MQIFSNTVMDTISPSQAYYSDSYIPILNKNPFLISLLIISPPYTSPLITLPLLLANLLLPINSPILHYTRIFSLFQYIFRLNMLIILFSQLTMCFSYQAVLPAHVAPSLMLLGHTLSPSPQKTPLAWILSTQEVFLYFSISGDYLGLSVKITEPR